MPLESPSSTKASGPLSPETLVDGPWFGRVKEAYAARQGGRTPRWVFPLVGLTIAGILFWIGWRTLAYIGAVVVVATALLEVANKSAAAAVHRALGKFGQWLGKAIGWLLLAPAYLIAGPVFRLLTRVMGGDPLALRSGANPSFWAWADSEKRRWRHSARMFCAERRTGGRNWLAALSLLAVIGFVLGELVLRFWFGFHNPLLYMQDSHCGYRVTPNQDITTGRGGVQINNYSMRYHRDVTPEKPAGVFRILMIGDSTLFGGEYLTNEQTYAWLVEKGLNERHGSNGRRFEVLPIGTNGWGPLHQLGYVEKFGTFGADLTLVTTPAGDVDRAKYLLDSTRYLTVKPVLAWQTVGAWLCWKYRVKLATRDNDHFQNFEEGMNQIRLGAQAFVDLGKLVRKTCPEIMFESLPQMTYGQIALEGRLEDGSKFKMLYDMILPKLREAGFDMAYPLELFKGKGTFKELFHDGGHLHPRGHRIYADYLISRITDGSPGFRRYAGLPELPLAAAAPAPP